MDINTIEKDKHTLRLGRRLVYLDKLYAYKRHKFTPERIKRYVRLLTLFERPIPADIIAEQEFDLSNPQMSAKDRKKKILRIGRQRNTTRIPKKYSVYIKSKWWEERKNKYYRAHKKICTKCGSTDFIDLHHIIYNRSQFGCEPDVDLSPLCKKCHCAFHEIYGVKRNMTKFFKEFLISSEI